MSDIFSTKRRRQAEVEGLYSLRGQYRMSVPTGLTTVIAAGTTTAGHQFSFRWSSTTGAHAYIRRIAVSSVVTTAFTTAQEVGFDLIMARAYTASHTGGTAIDAGSTITGSGKLLTAQGASLVAANAARVATTGELTAGTHTLDANAIGFVSYWATGIGTTLAQTDLFNAVNDESPLVLAQDEGFVIRNTVLMGAVGVTRSRFLVEWDEGTPI